MVDTRYVMAFLSSAWKSFFEGLMLLLPKFKIDKYDRSAFGVELTWGRSGWGLSFGLGRIDFWVGWPRREEYVSAVHDCDLHA